jgi:endonuclease V-like protein UPF0215 family
MALGASAAALKGLAWLTQASRGLVQRAYERARAGVNEASIPGPDDEEATAAQQQLLEPQAAAAEAREAVEPYDPRSMLPEALQRARQIAEAFTPAGS